VWNLALFRTNVFSGLMRLSPQSKQAIGRAGMSKIHGTVMLKTSRMAILLMASVNPCLPPQAA
jgi:hypothetical protein